MLDSALLRPGRFDRHISVDLPDKKGRSHILHIHARNKPLHEEVNLEKIAEESFGFSGAQLESVMNEAAIYAMRDTSDFLTQRHLSMAIDKVHDGRANGSRSHQGRARAGRASRAWTCDCSRAVRPGSVSQVALSAAWAGARLCAS